MRFFPSSTGKNCSGVSGNGSRPNAYLIDTSHELAALQQGDVRILREVEQRTGRPAGFIESDLVDPRYFSAANIKNRLESYFQMIEQRRSGS